MKTEAETMEAVAERANELIVQLKRERDDAAQKIAAATAAAAGTDGVSGGVSGGGGGGGGGGGDKPFQLSVVELESELRQSRDTGKKTCMSSCFYDIVMGFMFVSRVAVDKPFQLSVVEL
jgi:hypothetical protein